MSIHTFTVFNMVKRNAGLFKNDTAVVLENDIITFDELLRQVRSLSRGLLNHGVNRGDRIAILAQNSHSFLLLFAAAAGIGAIVVPINWRLSKEEIQHILLDSGASIICFDNNYGDLISEIRPQCKSLKSVFIFGESESGYLSFSELIVNYAAEEGEVKGSDPYLIIYTAAIQGQPRGAVLSHDNIMFCNLQGASTLGLTRSDTYLNILPLFHTAGFSLAFSIMHFGGKNIIIKNPSPKVILQTIERERVTVIGSFPPILNQLLAEMSEGTYDLSSLKHVLGIESPETITAFEKKTGSKFWLAYGQTETTGLASICSNSERPGSAGRPGPLVDLKIVDEFDREADTGKPGEILIRGPIVFQGYWGQEELTRYTFRDGWHHTGDMGRVDEGGYLFFVGRKAEKELIKPGGENVYPMEVEKVILEHPGVKEVSVIGVPDPKFGEGVKAVCVLNPNASLSKQELIDFVAGRIARYKKPGYVEFVDSLPKKEDGSIDRAKVKEMFGSSPENF